MNYMPDHNFLKLCYSVMRGNPEPMTGHRLNSWQYRMVLILAANYIDTEECKALRGNMEKWCHEVLPTKYRPETKPGAPNTRSIVEVSRNVYFVDRNDGLKIFPPEEV